MRVVLDLGAVQSALTSEHDLVRFLTAVSEAGGARLDLRIALDGTDPGAMAMARNVLSAAVPTMGVSGYVLPRIRPDGTAARICIDRAIRRLHLEALMPDVVLILDGDGLRIPGRFEWRPDPTADVHEDAVTLLAALRTTALDPLDLPAVDKALPSLASTIAPTSPDELGAVADALIRSARVGQEVGPPRLLVDVTTTHRRDAGTGIQRVVRELERALRMIQVGRRHLETMAVVLSDGAFHRIETIGGPLGSQIAHRVGETLLMLDALWEDYPHVVDVMADVRRHGGRVITAVYDIVPLLHPAVTTASLPHTFGLWFRHAVLQSDGLVCISRAVADEVANYIIDHDLPRRDGLCIGWWHLGSDLPQVAGGALSPTITRFLAEDVPTFLMVGTVEPRKRHEVALTAMEALWDQGRQARLLILGREGWNVSDLVERIRSHPEAGRRLLWLAAASDDDIAHAYGRSTALLFPSLTEGYGLPISEAARAGLGAIASDIPVLREVGGDGAIYVPVDDPRALAAALASVIDGVALPDPSTARILSWAESAVELLDVLDADRWHVRLRGRGS